MVVVWAAAAAVTHDPQQQGRRLDSPLRLSAATSAPSPALPLPVPAQDANIQLALLACVNPAFVSLPPTVSSNQSVLVPVGLSCDPARV